MCRNGRGRSSRPEYVWSEEMAMLRLQHVFAILIAAAVAATPCAAQTQHPSTGSGRYPVKPIRFVVPFSPGGGTDTLARIIAQKMSEHWGQPVVIENRTGAGGTISTDIVAKATPDGHTLLTSSSAFAISAALQTNLSYDPLKD